MANCEGVQVKTTPFDLEKALAGAKVVTRNGWNVTNLQPLKIDNLPKDGPCLVGLINGYPFLFFNDGMCPQGIGNDLVMALPDLKRVVAYHSVFYDGRLGFGYIDFKSAIGHLDEPIVAVTTEQQEDGTWKVVFSEYVKEEVNNA